MQQDETSVVVVLLLTIIGAFSVYGWLIDVLSTRYTAIWGKKQKSLAELGEELCLVLSKILRCHPSSVGQYCAQLKRDKKELKQLRSKILRVIRLKERK